MNSRAFAPRLIGALISSLPFWASPFLSNAISAPIFTTVDGIVRDGLDAPKDGNPDAVLDGSIVQALDVPSFEDRGIIEFSLASLSPSIASAQLLLPVFASGGPLSFQLDVFAYSGDGALTLADWNRGTLFASLVYSGEDAITFDVTSLLNNSISNSNSFIGFNIQFAVPSNVQMNGPFVAFRSREYGPSASLIVNGDSTGTQPGGNGTSTIAEPSTLPLLSIALVAALISRRNFRPLPPATLTH
jgi:hypothetical protein